MAPSREGPVPIRKRRPDAQRQALRTLRLSALAIEQGMGRPIDVLNDMQRALDTLYELEWERRRRDG